MKKILLIILMLAVSQALFAQRRALRDSLRRAERLSADSVVAAMADTAANPIDSLELAPKKPKSIVDYPIDYSCADSMMVSFDDKLVFLYGKSDVAAQQMQLKSDHMRIEMNTNSIFAEGLEDSITHERTGDPEFKDGKDEFTARIMKYNFKTKKGHVIDVVTEQQNGYLYGQITKMHPDRQIHFKGGKYTTCDHEHPHFYLNLTRAKMIPGDKIVSGPAYFVFLDVPIFVLGLPFGLFPQSKKHANGVIMPKYGEESRRGFYLQEGGYYFSFSDYADLELLGTFYSRGSWGLRATSKYKLRYKFSGSFDIQYSRNKSGLPGFEDSKNSDIKYQTTDSYLLRFGFNLDPKAAPNTTFRINISYDKQSFDKYNARSIQDYAKSTTSSSIGFTRTMFQGKANLSISGNLNQNLYDSTLSFQAPTVAFSVNRFFPFKRRVQVGSQRWYEKITSSFNMDFSNSVSRMPDSLLFKKDMLDKMRYGLKYSIPLNTSFNVLKYIQVSPSINYTGYVTPNYIQKYLKKQYMLDSEGNEMEKYSKESVSQDTINGFRHYYDFSASISATTKLYGMFNFNKARHIKAFRHVLTPSMGLSWRPDFSDDKFGFYGYEPNDSTKRYSYYSNSLNTPPSAGRSANLNFSLDNNFELKVKGKKDTIDGQYTKIKLLENLRISGSYNLAADSMHLSKIDLNGSTRLFDKMTITFRSTFDPYAVDSAGRSYDKFVANETHGKKWARFTSASANTGFTLDSKTLGKKKLEEKEEAARQFADEEAQAEVDDDGNIIATAEEVQKNKSKSHISQREKNGEFDYSDVPWSVTANYTLGYARPGLKKGHLKQNIELSGNVSFTDKWRMSWNSGYDFEARKFSYTRVSVTRDLHCFSLSFYIIPYGQLKSYNFTLAINSSMFQGIEYKRTNHWQDN